MLRTLRRPPVLVAALVVLIVASSALAWWMLAPRPPRFETLQELKDFAEGQGLQVIGERAGYGFFITDRPLHGLCKGRATYFRGSFSTNFVAR
jgi:hypothetical protein